MKGKAFFFELFHFEKLRIQILLQLRLLLFYSSQLIGHVPHLSPQGIDFFLQLVDSLQGQFQLQPALFISLRLTHKEDTVYAANNLVF